MYLTRLGGPCRRISLTIFLFITVFFSFLMGASAGDRCPSSKSHDLSAARYQMFTAYQTGYDGYQAPCELKCFEKESCTQSCQEKKAIESLKNQMTKLLAKKGLKNCDSFSKVCKEQCKNQGESCNKACDS